MALQLTVLVAVILILALIHCSVRAGINDVLSKTKTSDGNEPVDRAIGAVMATSTSTSASTSTPTATPTLLSVGTIAGIAIGVAVIILITISLLIWRYLHKKHRLLHPFVGEATRHMKTPCEEQNKTVNCSEET